METSIFYFSATGNSLSLARNLVNDMNQCELIPIANLVNQERIETNASRIGIIFPVFAWGMPRIVEEFVEKLSWTGKPYIFAIATCVAIQGNTLKDLKKCLRRKGADLHAGFAVKAGRSSLMQRNFLDNIIIKLDRQRLRLRTGESRIAEMATIIENKATHQPETSSGAANVFGSLFHGLALKSFKTGDNRFVIKDSCTGCGNCVKICPRNNIVLEHGRPTFRHNCELCHACIQWCSNFAIQHPNFDQSLKQYRNPAINLIDLQLNTAN